MNPCSMRCGRDERRRTSGEFVIVKNKLMSGFYASVLLLTMNFIKTMSKPLGYRLVVDNVMMKFMINNRTDA